MLEVIVIEPSSRSPFQNATRAHELADRLIDKGIPAEAEVTADGIEMVHIKGDDTAHYTEAFALVNAGHDMPEQVRPANMDSGHEIGALPKAVRDLIVTNNRKGHHTRVLIPGVPDAPNPARA